MGFLMVAMVLVNMPGTRADGRDDSKKEYIPDTDIMEVINKIINEKPGYGKECEVKIYNEKLELIRFGKENTDGVCQFVHRSDYLTEIDGIKYYRLSR